MKDFQIKIFILILSFYLIKSQCIQGNNCPNNQGFCMNGECICTNNYWTLKNNNPTSPIIYCNYKRISSTLILIAEFFIPSLGHFLAGKYIMGIIKLSLLLIIPILSLIIGFSFYYKDSTHGEEYKKIELSRDNNEENDNNLHIANREEKKVKKSTLLPVIICFVSLSLFLLMHIFDLICYLFSFYNDGYGAPLV